MIEIYKPIIGYENSYEVSNLGNIKSKRKPHRNYEKLLKPIKVTGGYLAIDLGDGMKIKRYLIHRIVATNFLENNSKKEQVNHIDGNKQNNTVENLEWSTRSENQLHSIRTGLRTTVGVKNSQAKLTNDIVLKIFNDNRKYTEIKNEYNISISTISGIKTGYSWSHITGLENTKK